MGDMVSMQGKAKSYFALNLAMVFWGLSFVATKVALGSFPVFTLVFVRFGLASCLFLAIMFRCGFPRFSRKDHFKVLLVACFEPGLYFVFETIGLKHTTAPKTALIIATIPIMVLFLATLFLKERIRILDLFGTIISITGITVLVVGDMKFSWGDGGRLLGDILILGAVVSASIYIVAARGLMKNHSAIEFTSMQVIYGALLYLPGFVWEFQRVDWLHISGQSLGALFFLTLFATTGAFLCYNYALTRVNAVRAAVFINGIPVITALSAWVLIGERLTIIQALGGVLVLSGVFMITIYDNWRISQRAAVLS